MKVYIVLEHTPYEGDKVALVTSNKQRAQSRRDALQEKDAWFEYSVEEYEVSTEQANEETEVA